MGHHKFYEAIWDLTYTHKGKVLWTKKIHNSLVDLGEKLLLDVFFRSKNIPTQFYVGFSYCTLQETNGMVHIAGEPSGSGYSRQLVERSSVGFPILTMHEGDYVVYTKYLTLEASGGNIGPVNNAFFTTEEDNSGILISFMNLASDLIIYDTDSLTFRIRVKAM